MIVKKIPNPKKSATKSARIVGLGNYIAEPQRENGVEKCIHLEAHNFLTTDYQAQLAEMIALASETRSKGPVDHWVLSWHEDEQPTIKQAREAVNIFIKQCGLVGHQYVWGLHDDTDNLHVHIQVNRVHPDTLKVVKINKGFDREAGQQAGALIEHAQGWKQEKGSRYQIVNGKPVLHDQGKRKQLEPTASARVMEQQTGTKSAQRIGIEDAAPAIAQARTWRELHDNLAAVGMRYERKGSGAVIYVGDVAVKASDVSRAASLSALQKRLGAYQPAKEIQKNEYHHHRAADRNQAAQQNLTTLGKEPGNNLQNLSERNLATLQEGQQAKRAGVLSYDAQPDRHRNHGLRRDTGLGRTDAAERTGHAGSRTDRDQGLRTSDRREQAGRANGRNAIPLKSNQPGWKEYQVIREEQRTAKAAATADLSKQHTAQRNALFEQQKAERTDLFKGNWQGKGDLRNAMQSILATQHAASKADLSERQKAERTALQSQYKPLPQYRQWKEQPQIVSEKVRPLIDQHIERDNQPPTLSKALKALTHREQHGQVTYQLAGKDIFRDEGKTIQILDLNSDAGIAAALATAQQKYGQVLTLTGSDAFKQKAVAVAVANNLTCKFQDPALDALRERLQAEKYQAERQAQAERAERAERAAAVAAERDERERAKPTTNQPAQPELSSVVEVQATVEVAVPALTCADWVAQQSKLRSQPRKSGDGVLEFVVAYAADYVVLDHGRTVALYSKPGFEVQPGQRLVIGKDGSLLPALDRLDLDKNKGQEVPEGQGR